MRRSVLAATALALLAATAPAHAGPPNDAEYLGGCGFVATRDPTGQISNPDTYTGVILATAVGYSPTPGHNVVQLGVTCEVRVNTMTVDTDGSFSVYAGAVGFADTSFVAHDDDTVELCTTVGILDAHDQRQFGTICRGAAYVTRQQTDPLCPVLADTVPSLPGTFDIDPDGDVFVFDLRIYDCPPYTSDPPAQTFTGYVLLPG